jgi:hypothetical protein
MTQPLVELQAPDISRWRDGGSGVDFVHVWDSGQPGPQVMVQALTHGNEFCGMVAACHLLDAGVRPLVGTFEIALEVVEHRHDGDDVRAAAREQQLGPVGSSLVDGGVHRQRLVADVDGGSGVGREIAVFGDDDSDASHVQ